MINVAEPKGIGFFNIKSGDTHYCKLEPTIAAYINSSDMGINASRDQDFGWRLDPSWVKKVRNFRNDENKMDTLAAKLRLEDGVFPSTIQILYYLYGREVRAYLQRVKEDDTPFEDQYQRDIAKPEEVETEEFSENETDLATLDLEDVPSPSLAVLEMAIEMVPKMKREQLQKLASELNIPDTTDIEKYPTTGDIREAINNSYKLLTEGIQE